MCFVVSYVKCATLTVKYVFIFYTSFFFPACFAEVVVFHGTESNWLTTFTVIDLQVHDFSGQHIHTRTSTNHSSLLMFSQLPTHLVSLAHIGHTRENPP